MLENTGMELRKIKMCTIELKSSAPFSLGGDYWKWYFDQR